MNAIVRCSAYRAGQPPQIISIEAISDAVAEPGTFVWLGLYEPSASLMHQVQEEFNLHELVVEDALKAHQRPKIETYPNALFVVLKTAQMGVRGVSYGETHLFVGHNYLVSLRHGASASYAPVRAACEAQPEKLARGPCFALYALIDAVVDHYQPVMHSLEQQFEALEDAIFSQHPGRDITARLYQLKREVIHLRSAALPVIDICGELMRLHDDLIPKEFRAYFRDIQDHAARVVDRADTLREMLNNAMQMHLALETVAQNEVVKKLAGWGAILALPTIVFSLYGMNFQSMPELHWPWAYPVVLAGTVGGCTWLYRKLKRSAWL